jgi:uncharacterized protein (TIRG00374 family)
LNRNPRPSARADNGVSGAGGIVANAAIPGAADAGPLSRKRVLTVIASIGVAALGYLAAALWSGWDEVAAALVRVGWQGTILVLVLSFVSYAIRSIRWAVFLNALGHPIPPADNVRIYLAGFALTTTPGKLGETLRSILLRPYGVPYATSIGAFFADRFCDLVGIMLMTGVLAQLLYPAARHIAVLLAAIVVLMFLIYIQEQRVLGIVEKLAQRISRKSVLAVSARSLAESALLCLRPRRFALGVAVSCLAWGLQGLALTCLLARLGAELPVGLTVFFFFFATLVGAASMIPSGIGSQEATLIGLLALYGVDTASAIAATLILRLGTLWLAVAVGLCCTVFPPARSVRPIDEGLIPVGRKR